MYNVLLNNNGPFPVDAVIGCGLFGLKLTQQLLLPHQQLLVIMWPDFHTSVTQRQLFPFIE